jgi:hypothetical protein
LGNGGRVDLCTWQRLKHAIDHADMKVNMRVQAGAKAVNESDRAQVQAGRVSSYAQAATIKRRHVIGVFASATRQPARSPQG